jgi:hypothetical protein
MFAEVNYRTHLPSVTKKSRRGNYKGSVEVVK